LVAAILIILILSAAAVALFWENLSGIAMRKFSTPQEYSDYVFQKELERETEQFGSVYAALLKSVDVEKDRGVTTTVSLDLNREEVAAFFNNAGLSGYEDLIAWLESLSFVVDTDMIHEKQTMQNRISFSSGKERIATVKMISDFANEREYLSLPGIASFSLVTVTEDGMNLKKEELPSREEMEAVFRRYVSLLQEKLRGENYSVEKGYYERESTKAECYVISYEITTKTVLDALVDILDEIKTDSELKAVWEKFKKAGIFSAEDGYGDFYFSVRPTILAICDVFSNVPDTTICHVTDYVSSRNRILGRSIKQGNEDGLHLSYFESGTVSDCYFESNGNSFSLSGTKEKENWTMDGNFSVQGRKALLFSINGTEEKGTVRVETGSALAELFEQTSNSNTRVELGGAAYLDLALEYRYEIEKEMQNAEFALIVSDEEWVQLNVESRSREAGEIILPKTHEVIEDANLFGNTIDLNALRQKLKESGFPEELLNGIL